MEFIIINKTFFKCKIFKHMKNLHVSQINNYFYNIGYEKKKVEIKG